MSIALERLRGTLQRGGSTQLGIGPISVECVDATIDLANSLRVPLMLIASRRQIDSAACGGGYVNGWTTEKFAEYVRERDKGGFIVLCRDHGGPWQNYSEVENHMSLEDAMKSAKESFTVDIESGFDIVHLDPSIDLHNEGLSQQQIIDRLFDVYVHCMDNSARCGKDISIEVGTEEQSGVNQDMEVFNEMLKRTGEFCAAQKYPRPLFVVAQTGTLVKETSNIGTFDAPFRLNGSIPAEIQVPTLVETCRRQGIFLKEHNGDYLSNEALLWHRRMGIDATNIAPEFGVGQTRYILRICQEFGLTHEEDKLIEIAYTSGKWKKWILPDSTATDRDRAIIAGHYVYSDEEFVHVKERIRETCKKKGFDFDAGQREAIKMMIMRIMACFGLYNN